MDIMSFISPQIAVLVLVTIVLMIAVLALLTLARWRRRHEYDPASDRWQRLAALPTARGALAAA